MSLATCLRRLIPVAVRRWLRRNFGRSIFRGSFTNYESARRVAGGYEENAVLQSCLQGALTVKRGHATFERDGVLFTRSDPESQLIAALKTVAQRDSGKLHVVDFGGAFGSTYFRHRGLLSFADVLSWDVVEQDKFVAAGRDYFCDTLLRFFYSASEAESVRRHNVLLCSTTFQYLADPWSAFEKWEAIGYPYLIFNNLPLLNASADVYTVQYVPNSIYRATYPVRFFSRSRFMERILRCYEIEWEYASEAIWIYKRKNFPSTGLFLKKRSSS